MMKNLSFIFIVGTVVACVVLIAVLSVVKDKTQEEKAAVAATQLEKKSLDHMVLSEAKMQEAQTLLAKKSISLEDQSKAIALIEESIMEARKAVAVQPDKPQTWNYLSEAYQKLRDVNPKNVELAKDALNHAIELAPQNHIYYGRRATVLIMQKKYQDAEKDLKTALKIDPDNANYYFKLGNVYKSMDKKAEAKQTYLVAKKLTSEENKMGMAQIDAQLKSLDISATQEAKTKNKRDR